MGKKNYSRKREKYEKLNGYVIVKKFSKVRLVGEFEKVCSSKEAFNIAKENGLDLILMSSKGDIPICKIMDYKKFLYDAKKKAKEAKKKASKTETKEIRLGLDIGINDMEHKADKACEFLKMVQY